MKRGHIAWGAIALAAAWTAAAAPAAAQQRTDGGKFLEAVKKREGDAVTELLNQPGSTVVNTRDLGNGRTALHIVVERRDAVWLRFLLQKGANPNLADQRGLTPLQMAVQTGFVEGVEALAEGGAQVDVSDDTGETPLIGAVHRRDLAMVRLLLDRGANFNRADNSGRSARDYARLMSNGTPLVEAMDAAAATRAAKGKSYGPN